MSKEEQDRMIETIKDGLGQVKTNEIKVLEIQQMYQADKDYGTRVAEALGMDIDKIMADKK